MGRPVSRSAEAFHEVGIIFVPWPVMREVAQATKSEPRVLPRLRADRCPMLRGDGSAGHGTLIGDNQTQHVLASVAYRRRQDARGRSRIDVIGRWARD